MRKPVDWRHLDDRVIRLNLYLSQGLLLLSSFLILLFWRTPITILLKDWFLPTNWFRSLELGGGVALLVLLTDQFLMRVGRKEWFDDGGINEALFRHRPVIEILFICLLVAVSEELLFRGVLQTSLGLLVSSLLFTLLHVRYLHHVVPVLFVLGVSLLLGWLYLRTGDLIASVSAHFLIDFVQGLMLRFQWLPKSFRHTEEE